MMRRHQSVESVTANCVNLNTKMDQSPGMQTAFDLDSSREQPIIDRETREVRQL